jgi:hypothetical protein
MPKPVVPSELVAKGAKPGYDKVGDLNFRAGRS